MRCARGCGQRRWRRTHAGRTRLRGTQSVPSRRSFATTSPLHRPQPSHRHGRWRTSRRSLHSSRHQLRPLPRMPLRPQHRNVPGAASDQRRQPRRRRPPRLVAQPLHRRRRAHRHRPRRVRRHPCPLQRRQRGSRRRAVTERTMAGRNSAVGGRRRRPLRGNSKRAAQEGRCSGSTLARAMASSNP